MLNQQQLIIHNFYLKVIFFLCLIFSTNNIFAEKTPLLKKLEACLPQNILSKEFINSTSDQEVQKAKKELATYLATEKKKYLWLYKEIIADATLREKVEKTAILITTLLFAYKNFYAFFKDPAKQGAKKTPQFASNYIYHVINALAYTLFYEYLVTPEKMSRPLAGIMFGALSCKVFTNAQIHGLAIYWALHHIFLQTTSDKLSNFLNCDQKTWIELKKQIPHQLLLEFEALHQDFLKYKTIMLEQPEQDHLLKRIIQGCY